MASKVLIIVGAVFLLAGCGFLTKNLIDDHRAGLSAQALLEQVEMFSEIRDERDEPVMQNHVDIPRDDGEPQIVEVSAGQPTAQHDVPQENSLVIGILSIPNLGIELPVINETSDELLNTSICRLSGSLSEKPDQLVIVGHNYKKHFGGLRSLSPGDEVHFTTLDGTTYRYSVSELLDVRGTDREAVYATDDWDITLITCKRDRTMRTTVRCVEIAD